MGYVTTDSPETRWLCRGVQTSNGEPAGSARRPADWFAAVRQPLEALFSLEDDWDSYGGAAPHPEVVVTAHGLLRFLESEGCRPPTAISATPTGGVFLQWKRGTAEIEIDVVTRDSAMYVFEEAATGRTHSGEIFRDDADDGVFLSLIHEHFAC